MKLTSSIIVVMVLFAWFWHLFTPVHPKGLTSVPHHTTTSMRTAL